MSTVPGAGFIAFARAHACAVIVDHRLERAGFERVAPVLVGDRRRKVVFVDRHVAERAADRLRPARCQDALRQPRNLKKKMYQDFLRCAHVRNSRTMHAGCGTFMITSRSSGRTLRIAKFHATTAPQSCAISNVSLPLAASIRAAASATR